MNDWLKFNKLDEKVSSLLAHSVSLLAGKTHSTLMLKNKDLYENAMLNELKPRKERIRMW